MSQETLRKSQVSSKSVRAHVFVFFSVDLTWNDPYIFVEFCVVGYIHANFFRSRINQMFLG